MKIKRFPKMVVLQYQRAITLGYEEDLAKAIGYAQALKYAILKRKRTKLTPAPNNTSKEKSQIEKGTAKIEKNKIFNLYFIENLPYVAKEKIKPSKFDDYLNKNFTKEIQNKLVEWAKEIIEKTPEENLKIESRFFNKVWKTARDQEIN